MWYSSVVSKLVAKEGAFRPFIGPNADIPVKPGLYSVKWPNNREELHQIKREENEDSPDYWRLYFTIQHFGLSIRIFVDDGRDTVHDIMLSERQGD